MGTSKELASLELYKSRWEDLLKKGALKWRNPIFPTVTLRISPDSVTIEGESGSTGVCSTFNDTYFDSLSVDGNSPVSASIPVAELLDRIEIIYRPHEVVRMEIRGGNEPEEIRLNSGNTQARIDLSGNVNTGVCGSFDADNIRLNGEDVTTTIQTEIDDIWNIIRAVDLDGEVDSYPVLVRNGIFLLDLPLGAMNANVNDSARTHVWNEFDADVSGSDVLNFYGDTFKRVIRVLEGDIELHTLGTNSFNDFSPVAIIQDSVDHTLRYIIYPERVSEDDWVL